MTYRKVCIGESRAVNEINRVGEKPLSDVVSNSAYDTGEPVHRPEIVVSRNKYIIPEQEKRGIFHIPLGKTIFTILLCSVSFAIGCSVTNDEIAECMEAVAVISRGESEKNPEQASESLTFYERYMTEEKDSATETRIEFLSAEKISDSTDKTDVLTSDASVSVSGTASVGTALDGESVCEVISQDMSVSDVHILSNQTKYKPDTAFLASGTPKVLEDLRINRDEPLVLVLHTHGTECYNSYENPEYMGENTPARSENTNENVVGVGRKLVSVLNGFGIPSVHSEKMCDKESFINAYSTSFAEAKEYLEKYPSIRFVIDLHRDAIELSDGSKKKPVFDRFGEKNAQLMFVVGTNEAGANHPNWKENLSLALFLQNEMGKEIPQLFRSINLRTASFNQQLSPGYLLLECGSSANTLEEAENAVELFATGFARIISAYAQ